MAVTERTRILAIIRHSPYGSSLARASLDVALAAAAFNQPVSLLFLGDGVLQLMPAQDCQQLQIKNIGRLLASLPLYDIEQVYVDADAADRYQLNLQTTPVPAIGLDNAAMRQLVGDHDHLLGF